MTDRALTASINWNGGEFVLPMIESLLPQLKDAGSELLILDNGSTDGSPEAIEERFGDNPLIRLERGDSNIGFGRAANMIIANAATSIVVLVNTDAIVRPGCLTTLLSCMEGHPEVVFAGPKLLWPDGTLQPSKRDFPFPMNLVKENIPFLRSRTARYSDHGQSGYTDWLIGAMMAVRTEPFLSIGGFSEDFLFFHEETDLQYRIQQRGWKVWFEASAEVVHYEGGSSRSIYGDMTWLQHIPGKIIFLRRNGTRAELILYRLLMTALQLRRMFRGFFPGERDVRWSGRYCINALKLLWKRGA